MFFSCLPEEVAVFGLLILLAASDKEASSFSLLVLLFPRNLQDTKKYCD
ncbi:hypothetical protein [Borreliella garinii]|nr:hypothetical protein [Borreliella garinii]